MAIFENIQDDLKQDSYGAFFGGGYGGAMMETIDIDQASPRELVELALERGID